MDMDWRTLSASAEALAPFWRGQALTGLEGTAPRRAMTKLRRTGLEMDAAMLKATKGVNTHKGLIYIMSLLLYGAGYSIYKKMEITADNVAKLAAETVKGSVARELLPLKKNDRQKTLSNGEKLFLLHGITGARGEAENDFPSITKTGLPELRRNLDRGVSFNDASLCALLAIMEINEDSNVIHRGGFDFWQNEYKNLAAETRLAFRPDSGDYSPLEALEKRFLPLRVSPGGAADLLACTLFLNFVTVPTCHH